MTQCRIKKSQRDGSYQWNNNFTATGTADPILAGCLFFVCERQINSERGTDNETVTDAAESKNKEAERQREKSKIIWQYYLVCSRTPVVWAGLEPCTPSRQDVQTRLWHFEVVPQSQLCSGGRRSLCWQKKMYTLACGPVNIKEVGAEPADPGLKLHGSCQDLHVCQQFIYTLYNSSENEGRKETNCGPAVTALHQISI